MAKKQPKFDDVIDGVRVRVYATRQEFEVIYNDDDIEDSAAQVRCYPKIGPADAWAHQGRLDYKPEG